MDITFLTTIFCSLTLLTYHALNLRYMLFKRYAEDPVPRHFKLFDDKVASGTEVSSSQILEELRLLNLEKEFRTLKSRCSVLSGQVSFIGTLSDYDKAEFHYLYLSGITEDFDNGKEIYTSQIGANQWERLAELIPDGKWESSEESSDDCQHEMISKMTGYKSAMVKQNIFTSLSLLISFILLMLSAYWAWSITADNIIEEIFKYILPVLYLCYAALFCLIPFICILSEIHKMDCRNPKVSPFIK